MNTVAVFRSKYASRFAEEPPGRALANTLREGLRQRGFAVQEPVLWEPFFDLCCRSGTIDYHLMIGLYDPEYGAWVVQCPRKYGFLKKLLGATEERELGSLLDAIHGCLQEDDAVYDVRWFADKVPSDPFRAEPHATGPRGDA
ncbi:MAG: hypothetical protein GTN78_19895 [Gemmatimonadales bacterium]|nr:hypothetical protein [Gemmatimonadales bacterium]NIN12637.1 hypothetical protein [Gemmatimonadales bacterium]NIR02430.1 hypothetical protein [Gemmatimonadales bacterium]NIS66221.1 hypothetical protein [Gemmatimonadales bacterium]